MRLSGSGLVITNGWMGVELVYYAVVLINTGALYRESRKLTAQDGYYILISIPIYIADNLSLTVITNPNPLKQISLLREGISDRHLSEW